MKNFVFVKSLTDIRNITTALFILIRTERCSSTLYLTLYRKSAFAFIDFDSGLVLSIVLKLFVFC